MEDKIRKLQNSFGFKDNETVCADCGGLLGRHNCTWAMGAWWHCSKSICQEVKNGREIRHIMSDA